MVVNTPAKVWILATSSSLRLPQTWLSSFLPGLFSILHNKLSGQVKKDIFFSEFHIVKLSILFLWLPEYQSIKSDLLLSIQDVHSVYLIANRTESFASVT